jgi:hypothetical protein
MPNRRRRPPGQDGRDCFLEAAAPAGIAATAGAIRELEDQHEQRLAGQRLALERAQYEADRAERKYDACEPENRLVARTLERALEQALTNLERERGKLAQLERARPTPLTDQEREALVQLTGELPGCGPPARQPTAIARNSCAR